MSDSTPRLEYLLLFGLPENKTEVLDGRMRTVWPFLNLLEAERAFESWCAQLERWRGTRRVSASDPPARAVIGGMSLKRRCRVIEMESPISVDVLRALHAAFWRRDLWDLPPEPSLPGHDSPLTTGRVRMNLWKAFNSRDGRPD